MEDFAKLIADLYTRDYPSGIKHDMTCRLACKRMGASSVSILAYSGKEDNLVCRGRYIDPSIGALEVENNPDLQKILKSICLYEFIFAIKNEIKIETANDLYNEFTKHPFSNGDIPQNIFIKTLSDFESWKGTYQRYKSKINEEHYSFDSTTISGHYFTEFIDSSGEPGVKFVDLDLVNDAQKKMCMGSLKKDFGVSFTARYYICLPLKANGRYFGLLRFLLPETTPHIQIKDHRQHVEENSKNLLLSIGQITSSHLEAHHMLSSNKKTYLSFKSWPDDAPGLKEVLSKQCDLLADIIESRGAIIRRLCPNEKQYEIVGHSKAIQDYFNFASDHDQKFFKHIAKQFDAKKQILGIHFNCKEPPFKIERYTHYEMISKSWHTSYTWTVKEKKAKRTFEKLKELRLSNIAIIKIPDVKSSYIIFLNSDYRRFIKDDMKIIYPAIQNLSQEWQAFEKKKVDSLMEACNEMHQRIARFFNNENGPQASLKAKGLTFIDSVESTIKKVPIFSQHLLWQFVSEQLPDPLSDSKPRYFMRIINQTEISDQISENSKVPEKNKCLELEISEDHFTELVLAYYSSDKNPEVHKIFNLEVKGEYDYFDLPFYTEMENIDKSSPLVGIITFIYPKEYEYIIKEKRFFEYMRFFSKQISMAWKNFQEKIALEIQSKIDREISKIDKSNAESSKIAFNKISTLLADEFDSEVCLFYLEDAEQKKLLLRGSNFEDVPQSSYSLNDKKILTVNSYIKNKNFRIRGNERIKIVASQEKLLSVTTALKPKVLDNLNKKEKKYIDIQVEHWLSVVLGVGHEKLGIIKLFRCKRISIDSSIQTSAPPFSEIESNLLERVQSHIFNIVVSFNSIQKRLEDMRNVLHQVISPLSAIVGHSDNIIKGAIKEENVSQKLMAINSLAKIATRYTRNFQTILELDLKKTKPDKKTLDDFGGFLENLIGDYQLLLEKKNIKIVVKYDRNTRISLKINKELIEQAIFCILDNIIKYSLDKEARIKAREVLEVGTSELSEDVHIEIVEKKGNVILTFSNWGLAIAEEERESLFSRAYRGEQAQKIGVGGGKGLGLYLVKKIVEIHGGNVKLDSFKNENLFALKINLPKD